MLAGRGFSPVGLAPSAHKLKKNVMTLNSGKGNGEKKGRPVKRGAGQ